MSRAVPCSGFATPSPFVTPEDIDRWYRQDSLGIVLREDIEHNLRTMHKRYRRLVEGNTTEMLFYESDLKPAIRRFKEYLKSINNTTPPRYL